MKKITFLLFVFVFAAKAGLSQYYYIASVGANKNPGGLNTEVEYPFGGGQPTGWTNILGASQTTPSWSPASVIPFAFQFNGTTVTSFKVSSTGILTFKASPAPPRHQRR